MNRRGSELIVIPPMALMSFVPRTIVYRTSDGESKLVPEMEEISAVVLFADISGFTKLSEKLSLKGAMGVEVLARYLNRYFGSLIDIIDCHGGDIIKIAGDALLAIWRVKSRHDRTKFQAYGSHLGVHPLQKAQPSEKAFYYHDSFPAACCQAAYCAAACHRLHHDENLHKAFKEEYARLMGDSEKDAVTPLNLHCALGAGLVTGLHCGGFNNQWEYFVCGEVIDKEIKKAISLSTAGEVVLGRQATLYLKALLDSTTDDLSIEPIPQEASYFRLKFKSTTGKGAVEQKREKLLTPRGSQSVSSDGLKRQHSDAAHDVRIKKWIESLGMSQKDYDRIKLYLPRPIQCRFDAGLSDSMAELRSCSIVFISMMNMSNINQESFKQLQEALVRIQEVVQSSEGTLRQFLVDDKGCVAILIYGMVGSSHEDDPIRAVRSAVSLSNSLSKIGIQSSAGCTTGKVFCGDVGSHIRREYAAVGSIVNTAAHLMNLKRGVLCDKETYEASSHLFKYQTIEGIKLKGKQHAIEVYQPNLSEPSPTKRMIDRKSTMLRRAKVSVAEINMPIVARVKELQVLEDSIAFVKHQKSIQHGQKTPHCTPLECQSKIILVEGESGIGKSRLLSQTRIFAASQNILCCETQASSHDGGVIHSVWGDILRQLLRYNPLLEAQSFDEQVLKILAESAVYSIKDAADLLQSPEEAQNLGRYVSLLNDILQLQHPEPPFVREMEATTKSDLTRALILHMLNSKNLDIPRVVLIDDGHKMDFFSWHLLLQISHQCPHTLVVIGLQPFSDGAPPEYHQLIARPNVTNLHVEQFTETESKEMACVLLGVESIPEPMMMLLKDKAHGNPFYIEEIIYTLGANKLYSVSEGQCLISPELASDSVSFTTTISAMVTQKIDQLGIGAANFLKVASVFGFSFSFGDLETIYPVATDKRHLKKHLSACTAKKILVQRGPEEIEFRSASIQEVAYDMLLFSQRKEIHLLIARHFEKKHANNLKKMSSVLARHHSCAEQYPEALKYYRQAAEFAVQHSKDAEVTELLGQYQRIATEHPSLCDEKDLARVEYMLGESYLNIGRTKEAHQQFLKCIEHSGGAILTSKMDVRRVILTRSLEEWSSFMSCCGCGGGSASTDGDAFERDEPMQARAPLFRRRGLVIPINTPPQSPSSPATEPSSPTAPPIRKPRSSSFWRRASSGFVDDRSNMMALGASADQMDLGIMVGSCFQRLAQLSMFDGQVEQVMYLILEAIHHIKPYKPNHITLKAYGSAALICALLKHKNMFGRYVARVNQLMPSQNSLDRGRLGVSYALRDIGVGFAVLGDFESSRNYLNRSIDKKHHLGDLRHEAEVFQITSHIYFIISKVSDAYAAANKLYARASTRGDFQARGWGAVLSCLVYARYGYGDRRDCSKKIEECRHMCSAYQSLVYKLDRLSILSTHALNRNDVGAALRLALEVCSLEPISIGCFLVDCGCLCVLLRYLFQKRGIYNEIEPSAAPRHESVSRQSIGSNEESQRILCDDDTDEYASIPQPAMMSAISMLLAHLKHTQKMLPFARGCFLRYSAYHSMLKGNKKEALERLIEGYRVAESAGIAFEMAAISFEIERFFPNSVESDKNRIGLASALIQTIGVPQLAQNFNSAIIF
eukprot:TRINITY_DN10292_c0_g1_i2.p1 TRINITY_DN10292_c0_g1~~TRINITY_DN10292_c0_g1_i2.p1  ORF type:complete len:1632 (-),score=342.89 TRINITY_DN10292_c0_g1_i2:400-5295(-)